MNLYIYSDLLYQGDNPDSFSSGPSLLSYSKLLKDKNSRQQYFGNEVHLRKGLTTSTNAVKLPKIEQNLKAASQNKQTTNSYLLDLNKQSLESLPFINISSINRRNMSNNMSTNKRLSESQNLIRNYYVSSSNKSDILRKMELVEGSRIVIRQNRKKQISKAKEADKEANAETHYRLRMLNNYNSDKKSPSPLEKSKSPTHSSTQNTPELRKHTKYKSKNESSKVKKKTMPPEPTLANFKPSAIMNPGSSNKKTTRKLEENNTASTKTSLINSDCTSNAIWTPVNDAVSPIDTTNQLQTSSTDCLNEDTVEKTDEFDNILEEELQYRVESPHKLTKSSSQDYKFVSNSSINLNKGANQQKANRLYQDQFELYQSSYFATTKS